MHTIAVIDDAPITLEVCKRMLSKIVGVELHGFTSSVVGFSWACEHQPDLIVVDYRMPEMDGLKFVERFRKSVHDSTVAIIVLTGVADADIKHKVLEAGASDFITKPADPVEFVARVRNLLKLRKTEKELSRHSILLEEEIRARTTLIGAQEREMLQSLTRAAMCHERDDGYGKQHAMRIGDYAELIGRKLALDRNFRHILSVAAPLHDIGKLGVPEKLLLKPGRLTPAQFEVVKEHAEIGYEILSGGSSLLMKTAAEIARSHHERWDGKGYPQRLAGEAIPVAARIVAVVDVFDALVSARPYRAAWSLPAALDAIRREADEAFDPAIVKVFLDSEVEIAEIRRSYGEAFAA